MSERQIVSEGRAVDVEELTSPSYPARMWRYTLAAAGPIAMAGANFLLLLQHAAAEVAGPIWHLTFLFAAALFTIALSSALFGAPMQALGASGGAVRSRRWPRSPL